MSPRLPPSDRGGAYASRTHVLSERYFLRHRFVWTGKLCGSISSGYVFRIGRQIDWLKRMPVSPGASRTARMPPVPSNYIYDSQHLRSIRRISYNEGIEHLRCTLEMLIAEGLTRGWAMPGV